MPAYLSAERRGQECGAESILFRSCLKTAPERPQSGPVIPLPSKKVAHSRNDHNDPVCGKQGGTAFFIM